MLSLFVILTVLLAVAILWFAVVAAVYAAGFLIVGIQLATGRTTIDELAEKAKQAPKRIKKPKRVKGGGISYPSPLDDPGLWI